jgi:transglutaminase-like putative cysteine protease
MPTGEPQETPRLAAVDRYFEVSLYLLILVSVLALVSTGKLDLFSSLLGPLAVLYKGFRWWRTKRRSMALPVPEISPKSATRLVWAAFLFFPADLWLMSNTLAAGAPNPGLYGALLATVHLVLIALVVRLYSARTQRDHLFLALVAFANMLAAAILTVDTLFLAFFFLFLVLGVSTFVSLEIRRGAEGAAVRPLEAGTPGARMLHRSLRWTSGGVAIAALLLGALLFLAIPRYTAGYLGGFNMQPSLISGFSDDVELGRIGEIKKSPAVVMRIRIHTNRTLGADVHWRGVALTSFDGHRWFTDRQDSEAVTPDLQGWYQTGERILPFTRESFLQYRQRMMSYPIEMPRSLSYAVLLEPMASDAVFTAGRRTALRGSFSHGMDRAGRPSRGSYLSVDHTGSVVNPFHNFVRLAYEGLSWMPTYTPSTLRRAPADIPLEIRDAYLQLPKLDPRVTDLARSITANASNEFDRAMAIQTYLQTQFGYTLEQPSPPPADPLAHFLFERKKGHCEYFATAMTVMLRSIGIPARYATGFLPGEFNEVAGDYIVRASDAHAWVEVYLPDFGWITFDPTPSASAVPRGFFARLAFYWDWVELSWNDWVINFDFIHQAALMQTLQRSSRTWSERSSATFDLLRHKSMQKIREWQARLATSALLPPIILGALIGLFFLVRSATVRRFFAMQWSARFAAKEKWTPQLATLHYEEMLNILARRGWRKAPGVTALEFAASLPAGEFAGPVAELTGIYQSARFGAQPLDSRSLSALLDRIRALLRTKPLRSAAKTE